MTAAVWMIKAMNLKTSFREITAYGLASGAALCCDLLALSVFVELGRLHYLMAAPVSFTIGTVVAYLICTKYVFATRRFSDQRFELTLFWSIGVVGLIVNTTAMSVFVELMHLHYMPAKLGAAALSFLSNYSLRKIWLFTLRNAPSSAARVIGERR